MNWKCDFCASENLAGVTACHNCRAWKCPSCGIHNRDTAPVCMGCSFSELCPLVLDSVDTGKTETLRAPLEITQAWLKAFAGEDAQFASSPQFRLLRNGENQWMLQPVARAKNPTFLNGRDPGEGPVALNDGDTLSIGSRKGNPDRMKIRVAVTAPAPMADSLPPKLDDLPPIIDPEPRT